MDSPSNLESGNINTLWTNNIYENLKSLENLIRLAKEGCVSLLDYIQLPTNQRNVIITDIQYKNLKLIVNELNILIVNVLPIIGKDEADKLFKKLSTINQVINLRHKFIDDSYSQVQRTITYSKVTPFFMQTFEVLSDIRIQIIMLISNVLYIKEDASKKKW